MTTATSPPNRPASHILSSAGKPKLLDQVRAAAEAANIDRRVQNAYVDWVRRFVVFHKLRHPSEIRQRGIAPFLKHIAVQEHVSVFAAA